MQGFQAGEWRKTHATACSWIQVTVFAGATCLGSNEPAVTMQAPPFVSRHASGKSAPSPTKTASFLALDYRHKAGNDAFFWFINELNNKPRPCTIIF